MKYKIKYTFEEIGEEIKTLGYDVVMNPYKNGGGGYINVKSKKYPSAYGISLGYRSSGVTMDNSSRELRQIRTIKNKVIEEMIGNENAAEREMKSLNLKERIIRALEPFGVSFESYYNRLYPASTYVTARIRLSSISYFEKCNINSLDEVELKLSLNLESNKYKISISNIDAIDTVKSFIQKVQDNWEILGI